MRERSPGRAVIGGAVPASDWSRAGSCSAELGLQAVSQSLAVERSRHRMREIVHLQAGQCGNQIGAKVRSHPWDI